jgi:hypothetical protein
LLTATDASPAPDSVVDFGERILAELGGSHTNSILVRWLAHHTARLVQAAESARAVGASDADDREAEAHDAILRLWQARTAWPTGWPPPRAAAVARLLEGLPELDDALSRYRPIALGKLQDIHFHIVGALVDLATDAETDIEAGWLERFGDRLSADEAAMLRRVTDRPHRMTALRALRDPNPDVVEATEATHPLLTLVDAYRETIVGLLALVDHEERGDTDNAEDEDAAGSAPA